MKTTEAGYIIKNNQKIFGIEEKRTLRSTRK